MNDMEERCQTASQTVLSAAPAHFPKLLRASVYSYNSSTNLDACKCLRALIYILPGGMSLSLLLGWWLMASQPRGEIIINSFRLFKFCFDYWRAHQHIDDPHFQIETTTIRLPGVPLIIYKCTVHPWWFQTKRIPETVCLFVQCDVTLSPIE